MLFGVKTTSGLRHVAQRLPPQQMKILRGGGGLANLHVVARGELQKSFDARAGMLRALAFVAVREKHHDAGSRFHLSSLAAMN